MKHTKTQNVIRLVATLALAISFTQASLIAQGDVGESSAPVPASGAQVMQPDALVGGQGADADVYICAGLVLLSPFIPILIIPAIPVCYHAYLGTFG